jgi:hypothetical protein
MSDLVGKDPHFEADSLLQKSTSTIEVTVESSAKEKMKGKIAKVRDLSNARRQNISGLTVEASN